MPILTYQEAIQKILQGDFPRYLFLQGEEQLLIRDLVINLRTQLASGTSNLDYVEWEEAVGDAEIYTMLATLPFGTDKRLAVVHNSSLAALDSYLKINNPFLVLVLRSKTKLKPTARSYKTLAQKGWIVDCSPLRGRELTGWLQGEARARRKQLPAPAIEYLRFLCGDNLAQLRQEIEKASLYLSKDAQVITVDVLQAVGSRTANRSVFELVDAVAGRKEELVKISLVALFDQGQPPVLLLALLSRHFLLVLEIACLLREGVARYKIAEIMGIQPFVAKKMLQQIGAFSVTEIERILARLLKLDQAIKQGQGNPRLLLETTLIEISVQKPPVRSGRG